MHQVATALALLTTGSLLFVALAVVMTRRHILRKRPSPQTRPPISLLKPLKGIEEELEDNLRSFFTQRYDAPIELIFATTEADDPALDVARKLCAEYPHVPARFVLSDASFGFNPKVANLAGALAAAQYDHVLQSDANVRVTPDYLARIADEFVSVDASLLSSIVIGSGEQSVGAAMENLQLSAFIAPATCVALQVAKVTCVIGKTMLFRKAEFEAFGGFHKLRNFLAEDFLLGEAYEQAGKRVVLSPTPVTNVNVHAPVSRFFSRHVRWLQMRIVIHVGAFISDLLANPVPLAFVTMLTACFAPWACALFAGTIAYKITCDAILLRITRGQGMTFPLMLVAPLKDLAMGAAWVCAIFMRRIHWRGTTLRLGKRSELFPIHTES